MIDMRNVVEFYMTIIWYAIGILTTAQPLVGLRFSYFEENMKTIQN